MEKQLEYRMYGLVPYNLSPIQQGIQFGHAVVEYMVNFRDLPNLTKWSEEDKTFIILNGGTTNTSREIGTGIPQGSLNQHCDLLQDNEVSIAWFTEPDLGDQLTAVVFLVDERVWNTEKYPDIITEKGDDVLGGKWREQKEEAWLKSIGGPKNKFLREFLKQFRLA